MPREDRKLVVQHPVRQAEVRRVDGEAVARGASHGLLEVLVVDAELGGPGAAVEALRMAAHHSRARVDAQPDGAPRAAAPDAVDLGEQADVDVQRGARDHVEVALRDVCAGIADLLGQKAALESVLHLARRAGVKPDGHGVTGRTEAPQETQQRRLAEGLEREPDPVAQTRAAQSVLQGVRDLGHALQVVDVQRRPVLAGKRLCVASRDEQAPAGDAQAGVLPGTRWITGGRAGSVPQRKYSRYAVRPYRMSP